MSLQRISWLAEYIFHKQRRISYKNFLIDQLGKYFIPKEHDLCPKTSILINMMIGKDKN